MADKTMVDYTAKIKPYFEGVAPVEPTTTAAAAHSTGDQFYLDGTLVEALTNIAIGDTLTLNTNYKVADKVEAQVRSLKQALTDEVSARALLGAHNILPIKLSDIKYSNTTGTWSGDTYTISGVAVEFTADNDYVTQIKLNGTASANITSLFLNLHVDLEAGSYICNGNPSGVTGNQYGLRIANASFTINTFFEQGATLTLDSATTDLRVDIRIPSGQVIDNAVFKPMLRLATDANADYQPYAETNQQLTQNKVSWEDNAELSAHNFLIYTLASLKTLNTGGTWNNNTYSYLGVDFTVNDDLSITVDGTSTGGNAGLFLKLFSDGSEINGKLLNGAPKGLSSTDSVMAIQSSISPYPDFVTEANGEDVLISGVNTIGSISIRVKSGRTVDNVTYKPMIRLATDTNNNYKRGAMTNQQLTEEVAENSFAIGESNCSFTVKKKCGVVSIMRHYVSSLTADTDVTVGTLPVGYRPSEAIRVYATASDDTYAEYQIGTDGVFKVRSSTANFILPLVATFIP